MSARESATHLSDLNYNEAFITGGTAGDLTVAGIAVGDTLVSVTSTTLAATTFLPSACANLSSEFSITAASTINNTGGTSTASQSVHVVWLKKASLG